MQSGKEIAGVGDIAAHGGISPLIFPKPVEAHVQVHQLADGLRGGLGVLQLAQALAGELGAHHLMVVEGDLTIGVIKGIRLANIVQQRRPAQDKIRTIFLLIHGLAQYLERVGIDVLVLRVFVRGHA